MSRLVGSIVSIRGLAVRVNISGYRPRVGEVLRVTDLPNVPLLVDGYVGDEFVRCINLVDSKQLTRGTEVRSDGRELELPVGKHVFGRVFNAIGQTLDDQAPLTIKSTTTLTTPTKLVYKQPGKPKVLETGIKVIDFFAPFVKGRRIGIIGGAGVGKTVLTTEIIHNVADKKTALSFFVGIGERIREGHELYHTLKGRGLSDNTIMYLGQMNENAALRSLVGPSAAAVARHYSNEGDDVLFFVDNIYRFVQARNELAVMQGTMPSEGGYQATMFSDLHRFEDSLSSVGDGTITSVQSIYIPADDLGDPAVTEISQQLDSVIVLSREVFERGIFPAVDLLATTSALLAPEVVGERHYALSREVKRIMRKYYSLRTIIAIVGESELSPADRQDYEQAQELVQYFSQEMFVTEDLTGTKGQYFTKEQTLKGVEEILRAEAILVSM